MRKTVVGTALAVVGAGCLLLSAARAEPPPPPAVRALAVPSVAGEPAAPPNLLQETGWVRLEIIGGRLAVLVHRCGQSRIASSAGPDGACRQQLTLNLNGEALELKYECCSGDRQTTLEVDDEGQVVVRAARQHEGRLHETRLVQPFRGALTLFVESEKKTTAYSAPSLWRLALDHPEVCRQRLFPLLESLRSTWRLAEQATAIESELAALARCDWQAPRRDWATWLADLDSDEFAARQQALARFHAAGQPALAWLARLPASTLSAEQRKRVEELTRQIACPEGDLPRRAAQWLVDDPAAWLALMQREDAALRTTAWEQFRVLRRPALDFQPEAAAGERLAQWTELRRRYGE